MDLADVMISPNLLWCLLFNNFLRNFIKTRSYDGLERQNCIKLWATCSHVVEYDHQRKILDWYCFTIRRDSNPV